MKKISITFIKDHPSGIKAGRTVDMTEARANQHIKDGYAVATGQAVAAQEEPATEPVTAEPQGKPKPKSKKAK